MTDKKSAPKADDGLDRDLFGAPVGQIKERWGRPAFAKTQENQLLVASLAAFGWVHKEIAAYLRCDEKTLRKHFSRELSHGAMLIEGQAIEVMVQNMRRGRISAVRDVLDRVKQGRAMPPVPKGADLQDPAAEEGAPLGKKEQLARAARQPGKSWGSVLN